jgi:hypothetical protein
VVQCALTAELFSGFVAGMLVAECKYSSDVFLKGKLIYENTGFFAAGCRRVIRRVNSWFAVGLG